MFVSEDDGFRVKKFEELAVDSDGDGVGDDSDNCVDDPNPGQENTAIEEIGKALDEFAADDTDKGIQKLSKAIKDLEKAEDDVSGLDLTSLKAELAAAARTAAVIDIDEARTIVPGHRRVAKADTLIADGDASRDAGDYSGASEKYKKAAPTSRAFCRSQLSQPSEPAPVFATARLDAQRIAHTACSRRHRAVAK